MKSYRYSFKGYDLLKAIYNNKDLIQGNTWFIWYY